MQQVFPENNLRCFNSSSLLSDKNQCSTCLHPFTQSFVSFECLPLVEFNVDSNLSHSNVVKILKESEAKSVKEVPKERWKEHIYDSNQQSITLNQENNDDIENSPFMAKLNEVCDSQLTNENYICLHLKKDVLATLNIQEVHFQDLRKYCPTMPVKYYKNLVPEISLVNCKWCSRFFVLVKRSLILG